MSCRGLRIISNNVADQATLSAANTAAGMGAEWLKTDIKDEACRINSGTGAIVATWLDRVGIDCVALPAWNGSSESKIRVRIYELTSGGTLLWDSSWQWAAPGPVMDNWDFHQPLNVNSFAYGATVTAVWVPNISGRRVVIDLQDPQRTFLDISRLVIGTAFTPRYSSSYGSSFGVQDMSSNSRAASGDIRTDTGPRNTTLNLDLNAIDEADRHMAARILREGVGRRHFVAEVVESDDVSLRQDYMLYGVLRALGDMPFIAPGLHAAQYQFEGI